MITRCPICGGEIQSTLELYTSGVVLDDDGRGVMANGVDAGLGETRVYCENDHTHNEIIEAVRKQKEGQQ